MIKSLAWQAEVESRKAGKQEAGKGGREEGEKVKGAASPQGKR